MDMTDRPLKIHPSLQQLSISVKVLFASLSWAHSTIEHMPKMFQLNPDGIILPCSVTDLGIKIRQEVIGIIYGKGAQQMPNGIIKKDISGTTETVKYLYRSATITAHDIIQQEPDFATHLQSDDCLFLRHLRNASAHHNKFYWGSTAGQRASTLKKFPVSKRTKTIEENLEGTELYFSFMREGDLFVLLSDISALTGQGTKI
jgi:hypothetical protein